jgi:enoyl-CoA hydratase/carnithine racemase
MFKVLKWHIEDKVGYLEINNPPSNPMDSAFFEEFYWWRTEIVEKEDIGSIIIHGKGRHFSSGAVLDDLLGIIARSYHDTNDIKKISEFLNKNSQIFFSLKDLKIPVIAAIRGVCLGSALELALCADYIICGEKAVLGLPETTFGLIPGCTGTYVLPRVVGKALATEIILSGKTFSPIEAFEWEIIQKIVPSKQVLNKAVEVAKKLSANFSPELKII